MAGASSDDWQAFLNGVTGLSVDASEPNASAFDAWRQALATKQSLPVWGITQAQEAEDAARAKLLVEAENKRRAAEGELLIALQAEAPIITVEQMLDARPAIS